MGALSPPGGGPAFHPMRVMRRAVPRGHAAGMIARWCSGLAVACALSAGLLAGCSSSSSTVTSSSNTSTPKSSMPASAGTSTSALCKSAADLKASITGLKDINIRANGTSAVSAQFTKIQQDFNTLKADAHGQFAAPVNALSSALSKLGSSLDAAKASLNAGTLSALASAAGTVGTAGTNLVTAVSHTC